MGWRLTDLSIRARLYAMVAVGIGGAALLLALATYAITEFRINGHRHSALKNRRIARVALSPPTIYLIGDTHTPDVYNRPGTSSREGARP